MCTKDRAIPRVNRLFDRDQKRVHQELKGKENRNAVLDAVERKVFRSNIWCLETSHNTEATWPKLLREEKGHYHQEDLKITETKTITT